MVLKDKAQPQSHSGIMLSQSVYFNITVIQRLSMARTVKTRTTSLFHYRSHDDIWHLLCHAILCRPISCYLLFMSCCPMLCLVILWYVMLSYVISRYSMWF